MTLDVKCAECNSYFPLSRVVQDGNGYYCKKCLKKRRDSLRHELECTAYCIFCNKELHMENWHTIGGYRYCTECSEKVGGSKKQGPSYKCSVCGEPLSLHEVRLVRDGKEFCEKCYSEVFDRDGKEKKYKCSQCGLEMSRYEVKMKLGENYCVNCLANPQNTDQRAIEKMVRNMVSGQKDLAKEPVKKAPKADDKVYAETAQLFKCLGDPCRVKIIESLADHSMSVFAFVEITGYQYSAISYHLKMLKEMDIVDSHRDGNFQVYSLTNKGTIVHEFIKKSIEG